MTTTLEEAYVACGDITGIRLLAKPRRDTRERAATFEQAPGTASHRPAPGSVVPGLALAGAWTATGWPATMEGAVRSGLLAAAAVVGAPADERRPAEARA